MQRISRKSSLYRKLASNTPAVVIVMLNRHNLKHRMYVNERNNKCLDEPSHSSLNHGNTKAQESIAIKAKACCVKFNLSVPT